MSWISNFVRPKIRKLVKQRDVPDNFWIKCSKCQNMIFHKELEQNLHICPKCGKHFKLDVGERFKLLFDAESFSEIELPKTKEDPLDFSDIKKYTERLKEYRKKTGTKDAMRVAHGSMGGMPVVMGVLDFDFMGGSMGQAVGEAIVAAAQLALLQEATLILVTASGGARMQEGMFSLSQMIRTTVAINQLKAKNLPYIVLLTDPTTGGVTASFAMLGDITIAEPEARIGFAGARVIEQTIHEKLPEDFQTAEYLLKHGMIDMVVSRKNLRDKIITIISILTHTHPSGDLLKLPQVGNVDISTSS